MHKDNYWAFSAVVVSALILILHRFFASISQDALQNINLIENINLSFAR